MYFSIIFFFIKMLTLFINFLFKPSSILTNNSILLDTAEPWQIGFQDGASPGFEGIVALHDAVMFYLVLILVSVFWMLFAIIRYFSSANSKIVYKYLNHGTTSITCLGLIIFLYLFLLNFLIVLILVSIEDQNISTLYSQSLDEILDYDTLIMITPIIKYDQILEDRKLIIKENKKKSGIYRWVNTVNGNSYIGSSSNLSTRFSDYVKPSYLHRTDLVMPRAFIKYGYESFSASGLEILEYCEISDLISREQFYLDLLNPEYNVAKVASSTLGIKRTESFKAKISKALKGNKNSLGRVLSEETKSKISASKKGLKLETKNLIKLGTKIHCYKMDSGNSLIHFKSFVSIREAARYFNTSTTGILYSLKNETLYKHIYKFSYTLLD